MKTLDTIVDSRYFYNVMNSFLVTRLIIFTIVSWAIDSWNSHINSISSAKVPKNVYQIVFFLDDKSIPDRVAGFDSMNF